MILMTTTPEVLVQCQNCLREGKISQRWIPIDNPSFAVDCEHKTTFADQECGMMLAYCNIYLSDNDPAWGYPYMSFLLHGEDEKCIPDHWDYLITDVRGKFPDTVAPPFRPHLVDAMASIYRNIDGYYQKDWDYFCDWFDHNDKMLYFASYQGDAHSFSFQFFDDFEKSLGL